MRALRISAQPMGGQEVITSTVGVIPQEEDSSNNISSFKVNLYRLQLGIILQRIKRMVS